MRFYFAAAARRAEEMLFVAGIMEALGHDVTSRWISQEIIEADEISADTREQCAQQAIMDMEDIGAASAFIVFTDAPSTTGGYHLEFGYARSQGKRLVVIGPMLNIFHCLPEVMVFPTFEEFVIALESIAPDTDRSAWINLVTELSLDNEGMHPADRG